MRKTEVSKTRVEEVSALLHEMYAVPCTGCRYCCADCPQELDIPFLLAAYNEYRTGGEKDLSSGAGRSRLYEGNGGADVKPQSFIGLEQQVDSKMQADVVQ